MVASLMPAASAMAFVVAPRNPRRPKMDIATSRSCALRSAAVSRLRLPALGSLASEVAVEPVDNVFTR